MIAVLLALAAGGLTATIYGIRRATRTLNRILTEETGQPAPGRHQHRRKQGPTVAP